MPDPVISTLREDRILYILRGHQPDALAEMALSTWKAGGRLVEVTLNSTDAVSILDHLAWQVPEGCFLGAGTVRRPEEVALVARVGVRFVVTPIATQPLVEACREQGLMSVVGASTPTEIYQAWSWGADFVKLFPTGTPAEVRHLRLPLDDVPMVAVGRVDFGNARDYLDAGCVAVGVGGTFYGSGQPDEVQEKVWAMTEMLKRYREGREG